MKYLKKINESDSLDKYFYNNPLLFSHLRKNPVDIKKNQTQPHFRAYKDESTSNFVNELFKNEDILNYFIFYNFQLIHYYLISNINYELEKHDDVLKSDEEILLIFKGGNVMHFYFQNIVELIKDNLSTDNQELLKEISELYKNFKTSDVDMSVYIINNDEQKYNLIYYYITIYLTKAFIEIRNNFDKILYGKTLDIKEQELPLISQKYFYNQDPNYDIYTIHKNYIVVSKFFENISDINNDTFLDILNNFMNENYQIFIFTDIYVGSRYISILQMIKFYIKNPSILKILSQNEIISKFISVIDNIIKIQNDIVKIQLENKLYKLKNFYDKDSLSKILQSIVEKLNSSDYQNKSFYNKDYNIDINTTTEYRLTKQITISDVNISPRKDLVIRAINTPDFYGLVSFPEKHVHFITVNNVIYNPIGSEHIVGFDLYRIKFNIRLDSITNLEFNKNQSLNIPSEFIDVSIPRFYDFNMINLRNKIYNNSGYIHYFSKLNNIRLNCLNVLSTNLKYTIKDLDIVLYEQNTFIPWNDKKYGKRIIRLLFLIFVYYFKKANVLKCVDRFDLIFDNFIKNLEKLSENIILWNSVKNEYNKENVLNSISKIIYFNDSTNNLLDINTLRNFYNYKDKLFFKIKYYNISDENNSCINKVMGGELDLSISIITKIAFLLVSDEKIYREYIYDNLNEYNYVFDSEQEKKNYVDTIFIEEYIEFVKKFIMNLKFIKNMVFENAPKYQNFPIDDLFIGGGNNNKVFSFGPFSFTDLKLKKKGNTNKKYFVDIESYDMFD